MTEQFTLNETTIDEIHEAMEAGQVTSRELVERYLDRIEAYDRDGPELNAIITVNPNAVDRAERLDRELAENGMAGPLHGVPVLVKDQVEPEGVTTTFGSAAFGEYVPDEDATIVRKIKEAGAVVLAKTNLPDWATSAFAYSSSSGRTKNPYAPDRDPGGSSAGTGAGVAANLGTIGIGEDTGGSIRIPAAYCNLFTIRVTTGLVSRRGLSPFVPRQDTPGPMARTVRDMTILLDVIVGYDAGDEWTAANELVHVDDSYMSHLDEHGLDGARFGVLREAFEEDATPGAAPVNEVVEASMEVMEAAGAELIDPVRIPDLSEQLGDTSLYVLDGKQALDGFLERRENAPVISVGDLYESGQYHELLGLFEAIAERGPDDPGDDPVYWRKVAAQASFQRDVLRVHANHELDAILLPTVQVIPPTEDELRAGKYSALTFNTVFGAQTSCPAVSLPAGFTDNGIPVGVELLSKPYNEPGLIEMAYAYEQVANPRQPPETAPPLSGEKVGRTQREQLDVSQS